MNISIKLCEHIRERIIPQYVNFDKAHRIDHVEKVIEESMKLALHYEVNSAMVIRLPLTMIWVYVRDVSFIISFRGKFCLRMKLCGSGLPMIKCCR